MNMWCDVCVPYFNSLVLMQFAFRSEFKFKTKIAKFGKSLCCSCYPAYINVIDSIIVELRTMLTVLNHYQCYCGISNFTKLPI
jgi:hypothetical protein